MVKVADSLMRDPTSSWHFLNAILRLNPGNLSSACRIWPQRLREKEDGRGAGRRQQGSVHPLPEWGRPARVGSERLLRPGPGSRRAEAPGCLLGGQPPLTSSAGGTRGRGAGRRRGQLGGWGHEQKVELNCQTEQSSLENGLAFPGASRKHQLILSPDPRAWEGSRGRGRGWGAKPQSPATDMKGVWRRHSEALLPPFKTGLRKRVPGNSK